MKPEYNTEWYKNLTKPSFQPPSWIFPPVWTLLYILMFASLFLLIEGKYDFRHVFAYTLFIIQLLLNLSWSPVFFGLHKLKAALFICTTLTFIVFLMFITFLSISIFSGLLLLPYLSWLIFACVLNFQIYKLNKQALKY